MSKKDYSETAKTLPNMIDLMSPDAFSSWIHRGSDLDTKAQQSKRYVEEYRLPLKREALSDIRKRLEPILQQQEILEIPYLQQILDDALAGGDRKSTWESWLRIRKKRLRRSPKSAGAWRNTQLICRTVRCPS